MIEELLWVALVSMGSFAAFTFTLVCIALITVVFLFSCWLSAKVIIAAIKTWREYNGSRSHSHRP